MPTHHSRAVPAAGLALLLLATGCRPKPEPEPVVQGKPVSEWLQMGQSADPKVRTAAVAPLTEGLTNQQGNLRPEVVSALKALGPEAEPAVPALVQALTTRRGYDVSLAKGALVAIGPKAVAGLIKARTEAHTHRDANQTRGAIDDVLREIGPNAVPALVVLLKDDDASIRTAAGEVLKWLDPQAAAKAGVP